jgi:hypothetical protein
MMARQVQSEFGHLILPSECRLLGRIQPVNATPLNGGSVPRAARRRALAVPGSRNAKRFPVALLWVGRSGRSPRASDWRHRQ